jgi:hypothetical protein
MLHQSLLSGKTYLLLSPAIVTLILRSEGRDAKTREQRKRKAYKRKKRRRRKAWKKGARRVIPRLRTLPP